MASVTSTIITKRAVAATFNQPYDSRLAMVLDYSPIQYLRLRDTTGTTAADGSAAATRTGTYTASSVPAMLAQQAGSFGGLVPTFAPANLAWIDAYTASLGAAASGAQGAAVIAVKMDAGMLADGLQHWFWMMRASSTYYIALQKWSTDNQIRARYFTNSTDISINFSTISPLWFMMGMDWSAADGVTLYVNGRQQGATTAITVPWAGSIALSRIGRDAGAGTMYHGGGLAEQAVFAAPLGAAGHLALAGDLADRNLFWAYGDSKTEANIYQYTATGLLEASAAKWDYRTLGRSGYTVSTMAALIDADLAATTFTPRYVLANLGANDVTDTPWAAITEAGWKANYQYIFSAIKAKWPAVKIYIMRPWRRTFNARCDTLATWIADLVTSNPGTCYLGPDERVFLEAGDDGATWTSDGIHPTTAGYALTGQQWYNVLTA
jgi:lysophospholipase L1-like esterase